MSELIDRQAFIEQERKLYCEDCDRRKGTKNGKPNVICYEIGEAPCRACWLDDALTDLEDFPTASPWHRVEEPPKQNGAFAVACVYDGKLYWCKGIYFDGKWLREGDGIELPADYWMPVPAPPKERTHEQ